MLINSGGFGDRQSLDRNRLAPRVVRSLELLGGSGRVGATVNAEWEYESG